MKRNFTDKLALVLPFLPGFVTFFLVVGPRVLDPRNVAWLRGGDPATHYLGWLFFRQSDWAWPPGANPDYGLELGSSIVYSDSLPLLAFFFKPFDALLPETFQYLGLWLFVCFLLHSYFAWKLVGLMSTDTLLRVPAVVLLLFAPPMLARLSGHWSLVSHFLILAALYITLRPSREGRRPAWTALLAAATLVHAYFLAMLGLIWLTDLTGRAWRRELTARGALVEFASLLLFVYTLAWMAGYFMVGESLYSGGWYGYYRANLLTFIDAGGWSVLLPNLPDGAGDYEGFNFLGLGALVLALAALPLIPGMRESWREFRSRHTALIVGVTLLALFAFSNNLGLGPLNLTISLPDFVIGLAETFRSSGRMLWPAFYLVVLAILYAVVKGHSRRTAAALLLLAATAQVLDTIPPWAGLRMSLMAERRDRLVDPPSDPFWEEAALRYDKVRAIPPTNAPRYWLNIAAFAGTHHMATDAVYLARIDDAGYNADAALAAAALTNGDYADDTLYIFDDSVVDQARASADPGVDLVREINGVFVLAPGWLAE